MSGTRGKVATLQKRDVHGHRVFHHKIFLKYKISMLNFEDDVIILFFMQTIVLVEAIINKNALLHFTPCPGLLYTDESLP